MIRRVGRLAVRAWRRLDVRVLAMATLALIGSAVAPLLAGLIPEFLTDRFDRDAVLPVLDILASSMLAVTTFSLGVMVSALHAASGQATPRAFRILVQDPTTQNVLGTFVGAFLFSLTAIVMFRASFYSPESAVVIAALTGVTIATIILAILRWIGHLGRLGSMDHTLSMVEEAARGALAEVARAPGLGAVISSAPPPSTAAPMRSDRGGYVTGLSLETLNTAAEEADATIWLAVRPGDFVVAGAVLAHTDGDADALEPTVCEAVLIGAERDQDQDPLFGLMVMAEIGARALSPGVNDPGTAIDVTLRQSRLLWDHARDVRSSTPEVWAPRLRLEPLTPDTMMNAAFDVVIRDGADRIEVMDVILRELVKLSEAEDPAIARAAADKRAYAADHARAGIDHPADRDRLEARIEGG